MQENRRFFWLLVHACAVVRGSARKRREVDSRVRDGVRCRVWGLEDGMFLTDDGTDEIVYAGIDSIVALRVFGCNRIGFAL